MKNTKCLKIITRSVKEKKVYLPKIDPIGGGGGLTENKKHEF